MVGLSVARVSKVATHFFSHLQTYGWTFFLKRLREKNGRRLKLQMGSIKINTKEVRILQVLHLLHRIVAQLHHPCQIPQDQTSRTYTKTKYPCHLMGTPYIESPLSQSFQQFLCRHLVAICKVRNGLRDIEYTSNHRCKYIESIDSKSTFLCHMFFHIFCPHFLSDKDTHASIDAVALAILKFVMMNCPVNKIKARNIQIEPYKGRSVDVAGTHAICTTLNHARMWLV